MGISRRISIHRQAASGSIWSPGRTSKLFSRILWSSLSSFCNEQVPSVTHSHLSPRRRPTCISLDRGLRVRETNKARDSDHPQNPSLNVGNAALLRRQARIEKSAQRAVTVGALQPCCGGVRSLLIPVPAIPREPPHPQCRVDLRYDRFALGSVPSVKRPEVDWAFAVLPQVKEPRLTGMCRSGDLPLNAETEDRSGGRRPLFGDAEPASLTCALQAAPRGAVSKEAHVRVPGVGRPVVVEVFEEALPIAGESVFLEIGQRERERVVDADDGREVAVEFFAEPFGQTSAIQYQPGLGGG